MAHVWIGRLYKAGLLWVNFVDLKPIAFNAADIEKRMRNIQVVFEALAEKLEAEPQAVAKAAMSG